MSPILCVPAELAKCTPRRESNALAQRDKEKADRDRERVY